MPQREKKDIINIILGGHAELGDITSNYTQLLIDTLSDENLENDESANGKNNSTIQHMYFTLSLKYVDPNCYAEYLVFFAISVRKRKRLEESTKQVDEDGDAVKKKRLRREK